MNSLIDHFVIHCVVSMNDAIAQANGQLHRLDLFNQTRLQPGKARTRFAQNFKLPLYR